MRIAMLSWETMHSIAVGGIAPHVTELSAALQRRGHEVHVFTRMGDGQRRYDFIGGVHYHRCPFLYHADFVTYVERMCDSFVWHLGETEHFHGAGFDVVHGHDWLTTHALLQAKNDRHRPVVFTMHSTEYGRCGNSYWEDPLSRRIRDLEWEGTFLADRVICVSKTLAVETHQSYAVPLEKIVPVYNGVNVFKYDTPVDVRDVREQHRIDEKDTVVFFAGRLTWQKGPDILLEAVPGVLAANPRTTLLFAGDGDMRQGLEDRAMALGVSRQTRFLGHRSGADLVGLFKSADVVCVPSRNEPFGIVILEAWSASKPVVATRTGGPAEFVQDRYTGITVETGIDTIAFGIGAMLDDMDGARQMGRNGRKEAEDKFTWDHAAAATERVYSTVTGRTRAKGDSAAKGAGVAQERVAEELKTMVKQSINKVQSAGAGRSSSTSESQKGSSASKNGPSREQIAQRAYEIYTARRGSPGDPVADWLQAERELRNTGSNTSGTSSGAPQPHVNRAASSSPSDDRLTRPNPEHKRAGSSRTNTGHAPLACDRGSDRDHALREAIHRAMVG